MAIFTFDNNGIDVPVKENLIGRNGLQVWDSLDKGDTCVVNGHFVARISAAYELDLVTLQKVEEIAKVKAKPGQAVLWSKLGADLWFLTETGVVTMDKVSALVMV
jgi:hypothetical protein